MSNTRLDRIYEIARDERVHLEMARNLSDSASRQPHGFLAPGQDESFMQAPELRDERRYPRHAAPGARVTRLNL